MYHPKAHFYLGGDLGKCLSLEFPVQPTDTSISLTLPGRYLPWIQPTEGLWDFNKFLVSFVGLMNVLPPPKGILSTGQKQSHNIHILNLVTWKFARLSIYYMYDEQLTRKVWKLPKAVNRLDMRNTSDPHLEVFLGVFTDKSHWL